MTKKKEKKEVLCLYCGKKISRAKKQQKYHKRCFKLHRKEYNKARKK